MRSRLGRVPAFSPLEWPVFRQLRSGDVFGRGPAVTSARTRGIEPRTATADRVVQSVCPFCAVGCGQKVYVKDERVIGIEGDPDSPISRGRLCPKGASSEQLVNNPLRQTTIRYRAPYATDWQDLDLDTAIDMIADRFLESRRRGWQELDDEGRKLRRTMAIASLVASIIGICCGLGSVVGIVLGVIALNQVKETRQSGHGLAVAGIAVGVVTLVISVVWTLLVMAAGSS